MKAKSLMLFLAIAGAIVWLYVKHDPEPARQPQNLLSTQQRQMDKAKDVGKDMQESVDQRLQDNDNH